MAARKVAVTDSVFPSLEPARQILAELDAELHLAAETTPEAILDVARQADGMLVTYASVTGDIIRQLERCQVIARFGIGVDNVDIQAATQSGIVVTYVPDYCVDEVSDHALTLLLALARKITFSNALVQEGRWELPAVVPLHRLRGRTLGLVGFGKIPRALAPKAQALGVSVVTCDPYISEDVTSPLGVELVDFQTLLRTADYISIHAPLTSETQHMFNAGAFQQMKPGALLINTARGPLVDEEALVEALDQGRLAGVALDVMSVEPPPADSPLLRRDDVIFSPHTAFYSEESLLELQTKAAQDVSHVLRGESPRYPINPQVLDSK